MTSYTQTATWPPKNLTDTEAIIDHIRQQVRNEMEREREKQIEDMSLHGVRGHLAEVIDEAERFDEFPSKALTLLQVAYDIIWEQDRGN